MVIQIILPKKLNPLVFYKQRMS